MSQITVALLQGGNSTEREVSLASGREVLAHLDPRRYKVRIYDPATDLGRLVADAKEIDVAFPALHGLYGEDGAIQGLLTLLSIPFVGSGILASAQAMDKKVAKDIYRTIGLPVANDIMCDRTRGVLFEAKKVSSSLKFPCVVKPVDQGSSVGLSLAKTKEELVGSLTDAFVYSKNVMVEEYLKGREFTVAILGNNSIVALPPIEIIPGKGHGFFDYKAKYEPGESEEICPCTLSKEETLKITELALKAHKALGCRGLSRTDFILSSDIFYLLETNTLPGFTSESLIPKAARVYGLSFASLLDRLIELALEKD